MTDKKAETEEKIFKAASRVFKEKGFAGTRMQEIADEADINKSMLHYYFRSKDQLFQKVFQKEMSRFFPLIFDVMNSEDSIPDKIENLIDTYYSFLMENPHILQFMMLEVNNHPERLQQFIREEGIRPPASFVQQIKKESERGNIIPCDPRQLLISIISLILFPFLARVMVQTVFNMQEDSYREFLLQRKPFVKDFILNAINYKTS